MPNKPIIVGPQNSLELAVEGDRLIGGTFVPAEPVDIAFAHGTDANPVETQITGTMSCKAGIPYPLGDSDFPAVPTGKKLFMWRSALVGVGGYVTLA